MNILKISNQYINIENVVHLTDKDGVITLFFNAPRDDRPYFYYFDGEDANKLREWLNNNSTEL